MTATLFAAIMLALQVSQPVTVPGDAPLPQAQATPLQGQATPLPATATLLPTLPLADDTGAWVIRIETSGGFTGRGAGSYTASSSGALRCLALTRQVPCSERLAAGTAVPIARLVSALPLTTSAVTVTPLPLTTFCSDCVTTTMTVRRRDGDGERTLTYRWDESTLGTVSGEVLRLHAAVIALASARVP